MKALYYLIPLLALCTVKVNAQSNYRAGSIVNLKGDTIKGLIDYKEWENNPASINFKPSSSGIPQQFTPLNIKHFAVDGLEAYTTYNGRISTDDINVNRLSRGRDTSFKTADVFLKVVQTGDKVTLYSFTDAIKRRYFIAEKTDDKPVELIYRWYYNTDNLSGKTINENTYKGQLNILATKYTTEDLRYLIQKTDYNQDIVKVVNRINTYVKPMANKQKGGYSFFAGAGATLPRLIKNESGTGFVANNTYKYNFSPRISAGVDVYTNPEVKKLIFRGELAFAANKYTTYFKEYVYTAPDSYIKVQQYIFSFIPQVTYNIYNTQPLRLYVNGGVSFNFSKMGDAYYHNGLYGYENDNYTDLSKLWFSVPLSAGAVFNDKVGAFVSYTPPTPVSNDGEKFSSMGAGIYYIFGQKK